jgi:hypothetical protein
MSHLTNLIGKNLCKSFEADIKKADGSKLSNFKCLCHFPKKNNFKIETVER